MFSFVDHQAEYQKFNNSYKFVMEKNWKRGMSARSQKLLKKQKKRFIQYM